METQLKERHDGAPAMEKRLMRRYECLQEGLDRDAVAICHHCSAGLCKAHTVIVDEPIWAPEPICKLVVLPLSARLFFCHTCNQALGQRHEPAKAADGERR